MYQETVIKPPIKTQAKIVQFCPQCGKIYQLQQRPSKCEMCECNIEFSVPWIKSWSSVITKRDSMWRYQNLMPVNPQSIISVGEGNTPIIYLADLSQKLKIKLYIKDESGNPTGTFKDREASLVISRSKQLNQDNLVLQSTGNTGLAVSYYAGLARLKSYFFGPKISRYKLLMPAKKTINKIILIDGTPLQIKEYTENFAKILNFPKISPFSERCEANATLAYEDFEAGIQPDFYLQTVAAGMGPIGYYTGYQRLMKWGLTTKKLPRIIAIQISQFNPLYAGWKKNKITLDESDNLVEYPKNPFEPTLFTTNAPTYYPQFRKIIKASGGCILQTTPAQARKVEAQLIKSLTKVGIKLNVKVEKSPFVGYAGLLQCLNKNIIPKGSCVLLLVTGKGAHVRNKVKPDLIIKPNLPPAKLFNILNQARK